MVLVNDLLWPLLQTELFLALVAPGNCCHAYISIDTLLRHSIVVPEALKLSFNGMFCNWMSNQMTALDNLQSDVSYMPNSRSYIYKCITASWALGLCPFMRIICLRVGLVVHVSYMQPDVPQRSCRWRRFLKEALKQYFKLLKALVIHT